MFNESLSSKRLRTLVVWELNQKHRMKGSFQDHPLLPGEVLSPRDWTLGKLIPWMDHYNYLLISLISVRRKARLKEPTDSCQS